MVIIAISNMEQRVGLVWSCLLALSSAQYYYGNYFASPQRSCQGPTGQMGNCISLQSCEPLLALFKKKPISSETAEFLRNSQCGFEGRNPKVCCPTDPVTVSESTTKTPHSEKLTSGWESHPNAGLLPLSDCGTDFTGRIFGGNVTELGQFPWMALFQYQSPTGTKKFLCGGTLINKRYILTAAHCLSRSELRGYTLVMIRLGEYNTEDDRDCKTDQRTGKMLCAPPPQDFGIQRIIIHPQYDARNINKFNDIGLVRLDRDAQTTAYVNPVCLPFDDTESERYLDQDLIVAGWGRTETMKSSPVKMMVALPVMSNDDCDRIYQEKRRDIGDSQICAGGVEGKDSCTGDSGGPLMSTGVSSRDGSSRYFLAGIVSYGPDPCGKKDWPGVYTRVAQYRDWILNQLTD